jgi:hypothetical protein
MAELSCPSCKRLSDGTGPLCPWCITAYVAMEPTVVDRAPSPVEPPPTPTDETPEAGDARDVGTCTDPDCPTGGTVPATRCRACLRSAGPRGPVLLFPWGRETVPASGALLVGRENSPLAARLVDYPNVGRRHAHLTVVRGQLVVVDLHSANGTFVNEERLEPMRPHPVGDGDGIRFAATLRATVRVDGRR